MNARKAVLHRQCGAGRRLTVRTDVVGRVVPGSSSEVAGKMDWL